MSNEQYAQRKAACVAWIIEQDREGYLMSIRERECAQAAFNAGWEARKVADYSQIVNPAKDRS